MSALEKHINNKQNIIYCKNNSGTQYISFFPVSIVFSRAFLVFLLRAFRLGPLGIPCVPSRPSQHRSQFFLYQQYQRLQFPVSTSRCSFNADMEFDRNAVSDDDELEIDDGEHCF